MIRVTPSRPGLLATTAMAPLLWGTTYLVFRELLPRTHPLGVAAARSLGGGALLAAWAAVGSTHRDLLPTDLRSWVLGALNIAVFSGLLLVAAARLPGGSVATLAATQPLWAAMVAWPLLGQRPRPAVVLASIGGAFGVLLTVAQPQGVDRWGTSAALLAAASMAMGTVLLERWRDQTTAVSVTSRQLLAGGALLLPLALWLEGPLPRPDAAAAGGWLWLVPINTTLAVALWVRGARRLGSVATFLGLLSPVVAVLLDAVVTRHVPTSSQLLGLGLVAASTVLGLRPESNPKT